jgi:hypothetical protein
LPRPETAHTARSLARLAELYHRPLTELLQLDHGNGWQAETPLPDCTEVRIPDRGLAPLLAARFAAANPTAVDTVLARLCWPQAPRTPPGSARSSTSPRRAARRVPPTPRRRSTPAHPADSYAPAARPKAPVCRAKTGTRALNWYFLLPLACSAVLADQALDERLHLIPAQAPVRRTSAPRPPPPPAPGRRSAPAGPGPPRSPGTRRRTPPARPGNTPGVRSCQRPARSATAAQRAQWPTRPGSTRHPAASRGQSRAAVPAARC